MAARHADPDRPIARRTRLARNALGLTQNQLADQIGLKQTAIGELEAGRAKSTTKLRELAVVLKRDPDWLLGRFGEDSDPPIEALPEPNAGAFEALRLPRGESLPVYGQAVGGGDGRFALNGRRVATVDMIPSLLGVENAYAVFVHGSSMEDRYYAGEVVYVHPSAPYPPGSFVVVQISPEKKGDAPYGYIKKFRSWDARMLVLEQLNPRMEMRFPTASVLSVHRIVFSGAASL